MSLNYDQCGCRCDACRNNAHHRCSALHLCPIAAVCNDCAMDPCICGAEYDPAEYDEPVTRRAPEMAPIAVPEKGKVA